MSSALFDDILSHSRSLSGQMSPPLDAIPEDSWTCPDCAQASKGRDRKESARSEKAKKKKKKKRSVVRSPTPSASTSAPASAAGACVAEEDDDDDDDAPLLFLPGPQKDPQKDQSEEKKRKRARPSPSSVSNCSNEGKKYRWNGYEFVKRPRENPKVGGWGNLALQDSDDEDACSGVKAADNEREREHRKAQEQMHEKSPRRAEPQHRLPQADQLQEVADTISDPESKVAAVTADVEQGLALERGELEAALEVEADRANSPGEDHASGAAGGAGEERLHVQYLGGSGPEVAAARSHDSPSSGARLRVSAAPRVRGEPRHIPHPTPHAQTARAHTHISRGCLVLPP